ncbi:hypothetical protein Q5M85_17585 [Paraclostridium bifermentans]|nr:hypothetical protein [Paraclostridium bifermentans]
MKLKNNYDTWIEEGGDSLSIGQTINKYIKSYTKRITNIDFR